MKDPVLQFVMTKLARRAYHSLELKRLCAEKGFPENDVKEILTRLTNQGYLDDQEWIASFIRIQQRKGQGPHLVRQKLRQKGLLQEDAEELLEQMYSIEKTHEMITHWLETHCQDKNIAEEREKITAKLYRKGFSLDAILPCLSCYRCS